MTVPPIKKIAQAREKELNEAITRIKSGRSKKGAQKLTITAVAREAGVSTSLIHNHYPKIAEAIRQLQGKSTRAQKELQLEIISQQKLLNKELRNEITRLNKKISLLISINENLHEANRMLEAIVANSNVRPLP